MTPQEKELMDVIATYDVSINRNFNSLANMEFCEALAKAIIAKYPQLLAEKVWAGDLFDFENNSEIKLPERFEIFIREVQ